MRRALPLIIQLLIHLFMVIAGQDVSNESNKCQTLYGSIKNDVFGLLGLQGKAVAVDVENLCREAKSALDGPCTAHDKGDEAVGLAHWLLVARWAACTEKGKRVSEQMGLSPCTKDAIAQNRFFQKFRSCKMLYGISKRYGMTRAGLCQAYRDQLTCVQTAASEECGPAYRDFFRDTVSLVSHGEKESECFPEGSLKIKSIQLSGFGKKKAPAPDAHYEHNIYSLARKAFNAISNVEGKLRTRLTHRTIEIIKSKSKKSRASRQDKDTATSSSSSSHASSSSSSSAEPSGMMKHRSVIGGHIHQ